MAHALLWIAAAHVGQGDTPTAFTALTAACELVPELGESTMARLVDQLSLRSLLPHGPSSRVDTGGSISNAELRVLRLMPSDLTYREIADQLYLSYNTVRTHARRVLHKLRASSRAEAVARARERDLL